MKHKGRINQGSTGPFPIFAKLKFSILFHLFFWFFAQGLFAQQERIEIVHSDQLEFLKRNGEDVKKLSGSVQFKTQGARFYCDSAFLTDGDKNLEAYSHIRFEQGDTLILTGEKLIYTQFNHTMEMEGNPVRLQSGRQILITKKLNFHTQDKKAWFIGQGELSDEKMKLTSQSGRFDTKKNLAFFYGKVKYSQTNGTQIYTDSLWYYDKSKITKFKGNTLIYTKEDTITTKQGETSQETGRGYLSGNVYQKNNDMRIWTDSVFTLGKNLPTYLYGNIIFDIRKDSTTILSNTAQLPPQKGLTKFYGQVLVLQSKNNDTTELRTDSMHLYSDSLTNKNIITCWGKPEIYRNDLQGISDSMIYQESDSIIYMFGDVFLWNDSTQMSSQNMKIQLSGQQPAHISASPEARVMVHEWGAHFNQLLGDSMFCYFQHGNMERIDIHKNVKTLYYLKDEKGRYSGLNSLDGQEVHVYILQKKINNLTTFGPSEAKVIPIKQIQKNPPLLLNMKWELEKRPRKPEMKVLFLKNGTRAY